jgi:beta-mannosidase
LECDKSGILIWHDLMYACALYPYSSEIATDIEQEMRDNLLRLRQHPSIALWNGNNEVWIGWQYWGWQRNKTDEQKKVIEDMYKGIFQNSLPKVINEITPQIPYWETSPSVSSNTLDNIKSGDIHFWRVWGAGTPIEEYNTFIGRFNSEYGMQSMPDISTIESFTAPADRVLDSEVLRLHERHPLGGKYLPMYVNNNTHGSQNLTRFSYFSQVMQSYALELATTSLRGSKPFNMGSLYWQLNDVWPVSSWATVDYLQVKKAAHYKIK